MSEIIIGGLALQGWITIIIIIGMFVLLIKSNIPTDLVFLIGMACLLLSGSLSTKDTISGFSSSTVIVLGAMYIVIAGLESTGVLHWVMKHLLGQPASYVKAILRLMLPAAALSAFMNNIMVVALFINVVKMWSKKLNIAPSKLLIPLSYASGMGGICTLIGTAPNLIVSGFYTDHISEFGAEAEAMNIFTPALPGIFCLLVGVVSIIVMQKLLPSRVSPEDEAANFSSNTTELKVPANSHLVGQTLGESNLMADINGEIVRRNSTGKCDLLGIVRFDGEVVKDAKAEEFLMGGDTLVFSGAKSRVLDLARFYGLESRFLDKEIKTGYKTLLSTAIMIGMLILSNFKIMSLLESAFLAALLMFVTRCCNAKQIHQAINWQILMIMAGSICMGKAIEQTGIAQLFADAMISACGTNALLALCIMGLLVTFLTEFLTNTACAAAMTPIAIQLALSLNANPLTFCLVLMIACSSSFATPIGSGTHMLVYVPGGYKFSDFLRIGIPMNFIILLANIFICCILFPL